MTFGTMLGDLLRSLFRRPATVRYPLEQRAPPERLRGRLAFDPAACTGCGLCIKDCPAAAIELAVADKQAKRFVMRYHAERCTFCAQCVQSCKHGCLRLESGAWELATADKASLTSDYGDLRTLDGKPAAGAGTHHDG